MGRQEGTRLNRPWRCDGNNRDVRKLPEVVAGEGLPKISIP